MLEEGLWSVRPRVWREMQPSAQRWCVRHSQQGPRLCHDKAITLAGNLPFYFILLQNIINNKLANIANCGEC